MEKKKTNIHRILLVVIAVLTVILAAVLIYKGYTSYQDKVRSEELEVRNLEVQTELEDMQVQIRELSDDGQALQDFLEEKINQPTEPASVTDNGIEPQTETTETTVTGNEIEPQAETTVTGNEIELQTETTVSGNQIIVPQTETTVTGNAAEYDTISGNAVVNGEVIPFMYEELTLEEKRSMRSSFAETMQINGADKAQIARSTVDFSGMKIACLGDSITAGNSTESEEGYKTYSYPLVLKRLLNAEEVYNLGIGGSSLGRYWDKAFVDRYKEIPEDTDIIIVMGGTNDGFAASLKELGSNAERKTGTFYGDVDELMHGLKQDYPNTKIVFATPLPNVLHDVLRKQRDYLLPQTVFADAIKELAAEYGIDVIDLYNSNLLDTHDTQIIATYMPDGVHGNAAGYQILAEHFASEIIQIAERDAAYGITVSGNTVQEESVSGNTAAGEAVSGNTAAGEAVSGNAPAEESENEVEVITEPIIINPIIENEENPENEKMQETEIEYEYGGEAIVIQ